MKLWRLKAAVQKGISHLPNKQGVNYLLERYVTQGVKLSDGYVADKVSHAGDHVRFYDQVMGEGLRDVTVLELGTGWYPIVPVLLYLCRFGKIITIDLRLWTDQDKCAATIRKVLEWYDTGRLYGHFRDGDIDADRLAALRELSARADTMSLEQIARRLQMEFHVLDAHDLSAIPDRIDFICSNNTFEHIPVDELQHLLTTFDEKLAPGGVMCHFIDLTDHYAHLDKSITVYNFLRYSTKEWARIDNDIVPQNRLRWPDYRQFYVDLTSEIVHEQTRPGEPRVVARIPVADEFDRFSNEDLAITHGYIVSRKPAALSA